MTSHTLENPAIRLSKNSPIVVKKFGGTSVGSIERIQAVAQRLKRNLEKGEKPVVIVSAMAGETNRLVDFAKQINPKDRSAAYDMLLASGEQVSVSLLAMALNSIGVKAEPMLGYHVGIKTDRLFSKARIQSIDTKKLEALIEANIIPVVAGFQGVTDEAHITTLGRGGSDTTAVALAAALNCKNCEIFTDVPAVFSADPRLVPKAREIALLSFQEMMEMASVGSKVLHFRCVEIAAKFQVPIHLRSTFEERDGTWIVGEESMLETPVVSSVTHDANTAVIELNCIPSGVQFLSDLFDALAEKGIDVDIISQTKLEGVQRLHFSVPEDEADIAVDTIQTRFPEIGGVKAIKNLAKISVIGVGMKNHPGVASRFFNVFARSEIDILLITTSDIKISAVVQRENLKTAAQRLHSEFELDAAEKPV